MARVRVRDVVGLDRREHRDAELVAAELAVRLGVDDAVGAQRLRRSASASTAVEVDGGGHVAALAGLATNGVANALASAQP